MKLIPKNPKNICLPLRKIVALESALSLCFFFPSQTTNLKNEYYKLLFKKQLRNLFVKDFPGFELFSQAEKKRN